MIKMIKIILGSTLLGIALFFSAGCGSSDKKADDTIAAGDVEADGDVVSKDINFDALGSDSGNIDGLSTVNFAYDSASISASAKADLKKNAVWIKSHQGITVQIEGHCDARGSVEYNLALGERRAKSVKNYLVSLGVSANRLSIISYGKEKPVSQGDSEAAHTANRRANFVPLPN